jgi:hypothetical protein
MSPARTWARQFDERVTTVYEQAYFELIKPGPPEFAA